MKKISILQIKNALILFLVMATCMGLGAILQRETDFFTKIERRLYVAQHAIQKQDQTNNLTYDNSLEIIKYDNSLEIISNPSPIFGSYPEFISPITEQKRFLSSPLILDDKPNLSVRAWRYSYNARGIIEIPNKLNGQNTAIIVVHPWGIDDGQGFRTPEPAGAAFFTAQKNQIYLEHTRKVLNPFLIRLRRHVALIGYSLRLHEDAIRKKLYRSPRNTVEQLDRKSGIELLQQTLSAFIYRGHYIPSTLNISKNHMVYDYFLKFKGLDASSSYNNKGFWQLPIPVANTIDVLEEDVVFYDGHGYDELRDFLIANGIKHILLTGYATGNCVEGSTAGYTNLKKDFNVFIVGDATIGVFPAQASPSDATTVALANASLNNLITEISWISVIDR